MNRILWHGGPVFTGSEVFPDGAVIVSDGIVEWVGDRMSIPLGASTDAEGRTPRSSERGGSHAPMIERALVAVDLRGRLLTPGWINAHTHIYSALARGLKLKDPPPEDFVQILERVWWRLDRALTLEDIALSAQLHGLDCLHAGVTTILDHHASQANVRGSLSTISEALSPLGLRACLCYEVSDREGPEIAVAGIEENQAYLESLADHADPRRRGLFGIHAAFTVSDVTLKRCAEVAQRLDAGFHLHVAEDRADAAGVIARLDRSGILGPKTLCVHGVNLEAKDFERLAETRSWLVHCPESNLNNAVGLLPLRGPIEQGVPMALGTDGFTADVVREALVGHLAQNHQRGRPGEGWELVPRLFLEGNATLASEIFGRPLGALLPGAAADLVAWDYHPPTPITTENIWGHFLFGLVSSRADDVWVEGRQVLFGGITPALDAKDLAARCRRCAADLWERY